MRDQRRPGGAWIAVCGCRYDNRGELVGYCSAHRPDAAQRKALHEFFRARRRPIQLPAPGSP